MKYFKKITLTLLLSSISLLILLCGGRSNLTQVSGIVVDENGNPVARVTGEDLV